MPLTHLSFWLWKVTLSISLMSMFLVIIFTLYICVCVWQTYRWIIRPMYWHLVVHGRSWNHVIEHWNSRNQSTSSHIMTTNRLLFYCGWCRLIKKEGISQQATASVNICVPSVEPEDHCNYRCTEMCVCDVFQGSHYILVLKFKDLWRTLKLHFQTNSRWKFMAWTVLQQYLICFCDYGTW